MHHECLATNLALPTLFRSTNLVLSTRIEPTMTYAMEVWSPPTSGRQRTNAPHGPIDEVLHKARRVAVGIHAGTHEHAWERAASVKLVVLDSDCQALSADDL